ncbi:MAG: 4Fe-4S binding protein [Myxococcota bacterium]|jgi:ferredoxin|nr:4Fe-4S binding protein [Myxococcota bacterium]
MAVPVVNEESCTGCEACVDECPAEAISMVDGIAAINADACTECGACIDVCPAEAISEP